MGRPNLCCNPLNKKYHRNVNDGLRLVSEKWHENFKNCVGLYVCKSCRTACYLKNEVFSPMNLAPVSANQETDEEVSEDEFSSENRDSEATDPTYRCDEIENSLKIDKVNSLLHELGEPPMKKKRGENLSIEYGKNLITITTKPTQSCFVENIKAALINAKTASDKVQILTTIPNEWSIAEICRKFPVSRRLVLNAKKLCKDSGYASKPAKKIGKPISDSTIQKAKDFYLSDHASRMMPGVKDCVSVVQNDVKMKVQKRLLLFNLVDLYDQFKEEFPELKIGLSKFCEIKPRECILAGHSGTHNVCVCETHQNMNLKIYGIKRQLKNHGFDFKETAQDFIKKSVCENSFPDCFLTNCKNCPGIQCVIKELEDLLTDQKITKITFSQWQNTDRYLILLFYLLFLSLKLREHTRSIRSIQNFCRPIFSI